MTRRNPIWSVLGTGVVGLVVLVVLGELTGHPLFLGYVETGSMDPVIAPGDGFIALSPMVTAPAGVGDLVVFESETNEVTLTVHRIVDETPEGYITKGDNSTFTDQASGEPPVATPQIVGKPLAVGGEVVTIPGYGGFVTGVQGGLQRGIERLGLGRYPGAQIALLLLIVGLGFIALAIGYDVVVEEGRQTTRQSSRSEVRGWVILVVVLVIVALPVVTFMTVPSGTTQVTILSSDSDGRPGAIEPGTDRTVPIGVTNTLYVPKVVILEAPGSGATLSETVLVVPHNASASTNYTVTAPAEPGRYARFRTEAHYPYVMPVGLLERLHGISPAVAIAGVTGVVLTPIIVMFYLFVGFQAIPLREIG